MHACCIKSSNSTELINGIECRKFNILQFFLGRLYESTGIAIALKLASASELLKF